MAAASKAKAACVIGWPVEHSRSPMIHGYWIKQHGLNAEYRREAVPPDQFEAFVKNLAKRGYVRQCDDPAQGSRARLVEADLPRRRSARQHALARWENRRSINTDAEGFINNLDASAPGWNRGLETAVVIGAAEPRVRSSMA
jgi:shikimate dehydrogenase